MTQYARPIQDITNPGTGTYQDIDEVTADDGDFVYSADGDSDVYEFLLSTVNTPFSPLSATAISYRIAKVHGGTPTDGGNSVTCDLELYEGTTQISYDVTTRTCTATWTTYGYAPTGTQISSITDYSNLRFRLTFTTPSGGNPGNRNGGAISWLEFRTPDQTITPSTIILPTCRRRADRFLVQR